MYKWPESTPWLTDLDTTNFEWKALPSGAHSISSDTIVFEAGDHLVICKYHARMDGDVRHRTASRAISAGLVIASEAPNPSSLLLAALPHLDALADVAARIADEPKYDALRAYADEYRVGKSALPRAPLCDASALSQLRFDPVTHLAAVHGFLGPLLVPLIKALYVSDTKLLIYCPVPVARAATIAFNLAEIVDSALSINGRKQRHVRIRGLVTLHEMDTLTADDQDGWIAWTSEKIITEKRGVADYVLDASDFLTGKITRASRPIVYTPGGPVRWTSRDAALFFELGEQARQYTSVLASHDHPHFDEWEAKRTGNGTTQPLHEMTSTALAARPWRYSRQDARLIVGSFVVMVACIRIWLAEWWLVRSQLRVVIPSTLLVPLSTNSNLLEVPLSESTSEIESSQPDLLQPKSDRPSSVYSGDSDMDPLVAASGCAQASPTHNSPSAPRTPRPQGRRTILPAHPRFDACLARALPFETLSGMYLFTLWSSWIRATHVHASAYLCKLAEQPGDGGEDVPLLGPPVWVSTRDMRAINLRARDPLDVRIVKSIFGQWGTYEVHVARPYFWWLCL